MKKFRAICPLYGFSLIMATLKPNQIFSSLEIAGLEVQQKETHVHEGVEVFNGVKIKRISKEDHQVLESSLFLPPDTRLRPSMYILEMEIAVEDRLDFALDTMMHNIVLALRLLKKGYVSGNTVFYVPILEIGLGNPQPIFIDWSWQRQRKLETWGGFDYTLSLDEFPNLKNLIQKVQNIDLAKRKNLKLACGRFERAYEEEDFEDKLIDIMIAFESLFLKGEKGNVSHGKIIAVGCSCLLGKNEEQRAEIESFLAEAYRIRNCVVHGSEYGKPTVGKQYEMFEFVSRIEDYLRESLKKLLD